MENESLYNPIYIGTTVIVLVILLHIWYKYIKLRKYSLLNEEEIDYGIPIFSAAILLWQFNSNISTDLTFNLFIVFLSNFLILNGLPFLEHRIDLIKGKSNRRRWNIIVAIASIFLYFLSLVFNSKYPDSLPIRMSVGVVFTAISLGLFSVLLFDTFLKKGLPLIGILGTSLVLTYFFFNVDKAFEMTGLSIKEKNTGILITIFGLYIILVSLAFSWLNDLRTSHFSNLFTDIHFKENLEIRNNLITDTEIHDKVKSLILKDKTKDAIESLIALKEREDNSTHDLLVLAASLERLNKDKFLGTISSEDFNVKRNNINSFLLQLL